MNFVDEKDIAFFKTGEKSGQLAGFFNHRSTRIFDVYAHRVGDDVGERGLAETRRAAQQYVFEHIATFLGGFHHQFKAVTAMSPLQFQKQLRLQEARRLMLGEGFDAASAAYRVGYHDASHFNREYKSLFGVPPMRDVQQLREATRESAGR